jgi:hypothetical protein
MRIKDVQLSILRSELDATPRKPGLGYDIDRDAVENLTLQRF